MDARYLSNGQIANRMFNFCVLFGTESELEIPFISKKDLDHQNFNPLFSYFAFKHTKKY